MAAKTTKKQTTKKPTGKKEVKKTTTKTPVKEKAQKETKKSQGFGLGKGFESFGSGLGALIPDNNTSESKAKDINLLKKIQHVFTGLDHLILKQENH